MKLSSTNGLFLWCKMLPDVLQKTISDKSLCCLPKHEYRPSRLLDKKFFAITVFSLGYLFKVILDLLINGI